MLEVLPREPDLPASLSASLPLPPRALRAPGPPRRCSPPDQRQGPLRRLFLSCPGRQRSRSGGSGPPGCLGHLGPGLYRQGCPTPSQMAPSCGVRSGGGTGGRGGVQARNSSGGGTTGSLEEQAALPVTPAGSPQSGCWCPDGRKAQVGERGHCQEPVPGVRTEGTRVSIWRVNPD